MELITDRTHADCERARYLIDKVHAGETLTEAERAEYFGGLRGAYTMAIDWNRVETEVEEISEAFGMGLETKTDWTYQDIATREEIERYLFNIEHIRMHIKTDEIIPETPKIEEWIDYRGANAIEKILLMAEGNIKALLLATSNGELLVTSDGNYLELALTANN